MIGGRTSSLQPRSRGLLPRRPCPGAAAGGARGCCAADPAPQASIAAVASPASHERITCKAPRLMCHNTPRMTGLVGANSCLSSPGTAAVLAGLEVKCNHDVLLPYPATTQCPACNVRPKRGFSQSGCVCVRIKVTVRARVGLGCARLVSPPGLQALLQARGAVEGGVVLVVALVEEAADLVNPALAVVALDPALLHLCSSIDTSEGKTSEARRKRSEAFTPVHRGR